MADLDIENDSAEAPLRRAIGNVSVDATQGPLLRDIIIALLALGAETPPATSLLGTDGSSNKLYYTMTALMNSLDTVLAPASVADGATITLDLGNSRNFVVGALGGNRTLAFSNYTGKGGRRGRIHITQDGTGSRTLTGGTDVTQQGNIGSVISINKVASSTTVLEYYVTSTDKIIIMPAFEDNLNVPVAVADGATITINLDAGRNFEVAAMGGNRTLQFSNYTGKAGRTGWIEILQDGTGGRTLAAGTDVLPSDATAGVIALNDGINERTSLPYRITTANKIVLG